MKDSTALRTMAFLIVIWSVITLAVSLPHLYLGPEEEPPMIPKVGEGNYTTESGNSGDFARILYIVFIGSLIGLSVLYIIISILNRDKEAFKEIMGALLVLAITSAFFLGAMYLMEHPEITGGGGRNETGNASAGTGVNTVYRPAGAVQYVAVLFVLSLGIIGVVRYAMALRSQKIEKVESQSAELREKMMLAIKDLKKGKEVQEVIIRCYDEMCRILSKSSGMREGDSMTPREFERAILERMEIDRAPVSRLTGLFEEAKYSTHPIDDSKRREAIKALEELRNEVERWEREGGK